MNITHQNIPTLLIPAIALLSLLPATTSAEWGVGVSMETTQSMYKKNKPKGTEISVNASPRIECRGERLKIHDGTLSYAVINADKYAIDVLTSSKNQGYEATDKNIFKGMKEREPSLDMGVRLRADTAYIPVSLAVTKDINKSKGMEVGLSLGGLQTSKKRWDGKRSFSIAPIAGANWQSKKAVDYYSRLNFPSQYRHHSLNICRL